MAIILVTTRPVKIFMPDDIADQIDVFKRVIICLTCNIYLIEYDILY